MPEGLGTISTKAAYIKSGNFAFKDRFFVAFVSGILATNPLYQPPLKQNFELARFKVIAPDYIVANSAPVISKFIDQLTIYANKYEQFTVGEVWDAENIKTLSVEITATCLNNPIDWIKLSDADASKIALVLRPPQDSKDDTCTVKLKVCDNDAISPMSIQKTVQIFVKAQQFEAVEIMKDLEPIIGQQPVLVKTEVDESGKFSFMFDMELLYPDQMYELTSENEGSTYFRCTLQIDKANLAEDGEEAFENTIDDPYSFTWQVQRTKTNTEI